MKNNSTKLLINSVLALTILFISVGAANAQLKVLQNGNTTIGGGNSSFPYSATKLSINGSASVKSSLEVMNLSNTNAAWGGQIRFTRNDLSGINHIIVDNGSDEMILFPGFSQPTTNKHVRIFGGLIVNGYSSLAGGGYFSDSKLKTNVKPLENCLSKVLKMRGVNYQWKPEVIIKSGEEKINITEGLPKGKQVGFIAQEMEEIVPELVRDDKNGYKTLEYHTLTAFLVEAIKEQQQQINALQKKLNEISKGEVEPIKMEEKRRN